MCVTLNYFQIYINVYIFISLRYFEILAKTEFLEQIKYVSYCALKDPNRKHFQQLVMLSNIVLKEIFF